MSLVSLDELNAQIGEMLGEYAEEVKASMERVLDQTAEKVLDYIRSKAPRSGRAEGYADSFVAISKGEGVNKTISIYSGTKGRLTHLLEFGFTHRGGKFVGPRPFLRPAYDSYAPEMVEEVRRIIERGGGA